MKNFEFLNPTEIVFGTDALTSLARHIKNAGGHKVLLHYGGGSVLKSGLLRQIKELLTANGLSYVEVGGVVPNPRLQLALKGAEIAKRENVDFVLAIGGGSVIDSAKCLAGAFYEKNIWDYFMDDSQTVTKALPIGVVLTIPAAGSESSDGAVITDEVSKLKRDIGSNVFFPKFAIINPEWTFSLPDTQIAYGIADILAHMLERYFTGISNVDFTSNILEGGIRSLLKNGVKVFSDKLNYDLRAEVSLTATFAHNGMFGVGRIGDWGSHMIEHELSATYDIAHGAGLAIIFPAWLKYLHKCGAGKEIFKRFAKEIFDKDDVLSGIEKLEEFFHEIGLPTRLKDIGIGNEHFAEMSKNAVLNRGTVGNLKRLTADDVYQIFLLAE